MLLPDTTGRTILTDCSVEHFSHLLSWLAQGDCMILFCLKVCCSGPNLKSFFMSHGREGWLPVCNLEYALSKNPQHSGIVLPFIPSQIHLASSTVSCWDAPVTPEVQMDSVSTYLHGIRVHCVLVSTKALYSWGLMCQAIGSNYRIHWANRSDYPFPPSGWGQDLVIVLIAHSL